VSSPPAALRQQALRWLAQREHSRQELQGKLQRWLSRQPLVGQPDALDAESLARHISTTLDTLEAAGWLNTERFVESRLRQRQSRFGNRRITAELRQHGLQANPEQQALLVSTEAERAFKALSQRFGEQPVASSSGPLEVPELDDDNHFGNLRGQGRAGPIAPVLRERLKHQRFLAARGFSSEAIQKALRAHAQAASTASRADDAEVTDTAC
jgi:regulatory protein